VGDEYFLNIQNEEGCPKRKLGKILPCIILFFADMLLQSYSGVVS
jgi:pyruvoyl-dependent arginine decarboxylase (PvlArgDC)